MGRASRKITVDALEDAIARAKTVVNSPTTATARMSASWVPSGAPVSWVNIQEESAITRSATPHSMPLTLTL
ncbi:hypothetical protein GCM10009808_21240 [Microbacterium sediminicola]|uniref:Uncharacterized protein n=1 Tax=Microbacterium sediminicola TaxID=415210 RepID=A0ABN2IDS9_9MICO